MLVEGIWMEKPTESLKIPLSHVIILQIDYRNPQSIIYIV